MKRWNVCNHDRGPFPGVSPDWPGPEKALLDLSHMLNCHFDVIETQSESSRGKSEKVFKIEVHTHSGYKIKSSDVSSFEKYNDFYKRVQLWWTLCKSIFESIRDYICYDGHSFCVYCGPQKTIELNMNLTEALNTLDRGVKK